jgi:CBS domain-containing protein
LIASKGENCIGIITEQDLIERTMYQQRFAKHTLVHEVRSKDIKIVHVLDTVEYPLKIMTQNKIKKLPIVSDEKVVRIVTVTDIAKARPDLSKRVTDTWGKPQWKN